MAERELLSGEVGRLAEQHARGDHERDASRRQREQHRHEYELSGEYCAVADLEHDARHDRVAEHGDQSGGERERANGGEEDHGSGGGDDERAGQRDGDLFGTVAQAQPRLNAGTRDQLRADVVGMKMRNRRCLECRHAIP